MARCSVLDRRLQVEGELNLAHLRRYFDTGFLADKGHKFLDFLRRNALDDFLKSDQGEELIANHPRKNDVRLEVQYDSLKRNRQMVISGGHNIVRGVCRYESGGLSS